MSCKASKNKKIKSRDCRKSLSIAIVFICQSDRKFYAKLSHARYHSCSYGYKADGYQYLNKVNQIIPIPKFQNYRK